MAIGTYYKSIPHIIDELMQGKYITIETDSGEFFKYDISGRVPRLLFYSSKIHYIHTSGS